jgi:small subunit ribosomal protein S20
MPDTKSEEQRKRKSVKERRMRKSARRALRNRRVKTRLKTLEKGYLQALSTGQREACVEALRRVQSALDKAAQSGVIHWAKACRKKSRLAQRLAALS